MSQYKIGTISVTNGSATITGTGTLWLANIAVGDLIVAAPDSVAYVVSGVASDTSLTVTAPYGGTTASGLTYSAHKDFHPNGSPLFDEADIEFPAIQNDWNAKSVPVGGFGTAATEDVTTSATDSTTGRVTKVGDFGVGSAISPATTDADVITESGFYSTGSSWTGSVFAGTDGFNQGYLLHKAWGSSTYGSQEFFNVNGPWEKLTRRKEAGIWTAWVEDFHANNIATYNGAQQGATDNGSIIESGSNANGEYVKYADGTMICYGTLAAGATGTKTLPATLINTDYRVLATQNNADTVVDVVGIFSLSTRTPSTFPYRWQTRTDVTADFTAIGRWK